MPYPSLEQYNEVLQHPNLALVDPTLKRGTIATTGLGLPLAMCGGFALTYTLSVSGTKYAVRCFHKESKNLEQRYAAISRRLKSLSSKYFLDFEFQRLGVRVGGSEFPIVRMAWASGVTLATFVESNLRNKGALDHLASSLSVLSAYLLWHLADTMRMGCARQSLIDREDIYENAIIKNRLRIIKLDLAGHEITTSADFAAFEDTRLLLLVSFPTVLVFSNILIEAVTYLVGFFSGLIKTAIAHARGIDNLAPDKADSIMRQLKKGTVGLIAVGLGYVGIYSVWGLLAGVLYIGLIVWLSFAQKKSTRVSNSNP